MRIYRCYRRFSSSKDRRRLRPGPGAGLRINTGLVGSPIPHSLIATVNRWPSKTRSSRTVLFARGMGCPSHLCEGLTTATGRPLPKQTFQAVLRNPLYSGFVTLPSDPDFERVKGLHEAIVEQDTFDRVQSNLDGRKPTAAPKRKINPLLPLKCLVRCESCGTPLTGGLAKGRSKKYPRYWCRKEGCRAVKLSSSQLETEFLALLARLKPTQETVAAFPR